MFIAIASPTASYIPCYHICARRMVDRSHASKQPERQRPNSLPSFVAAFSPYAIAMPEEERPPMPFLCEE